MTYIGPEPNPGQNREVDDISSGFNGSEVNFTLQVNSQNVSPGSSNNIIVSLGGVVQNPSTDYTVAASTLTFTTAPASGLSFFGLVLGQQVDIQSLADGTSPTMSAPSVTGDLSIADKIVHTGDTNTAIRFPAADSITAETGGSERAKIDSSGNILVGGASLGAAGSFGMEQDGHVRSVLASGTTGDTLFGAISGVSNGFQVNISGTNVQKYKFHNGSTQTLLIDSDGLKFMNDTAAANALDDYEEGTYTPGDASGQSIVFSNAEGLYTKVGRLVHVQGSVTFPSTGGQFGFAISLPFTATASGRTAGGGDIRYTTHTTAFNLHVNASTTHFSGYNFGGTIQKNADLSTDRLDFQLTYAVA